MTILLTAILGNERERLSVAVGSAQGVEGRAAHARGRVHRGMFITSLPLIRIRHAHINKHTQRDIYLL
jgi:hypothetical protein